VLSSLLFLYLCKNKKNIIMGRGDIKTKKGKTFAGSFGKVRPAKVVKKATPKKKD
jgi:30S ribosomal protein S31